MAWTCRNDGICYAYIIGVRKSFEKHETRKNEMRV